MHLKKSDPYVTKYFISFSKQSVYGVLVVAVMSNRQTPFAGYSKNPKVVSQSLQVTEFDALK